MCKAGVINLYIIKLPMDGFTLQFLWPITQKTKHSRVTQHFENRTCFRPQPTTRVGPLEKDYPQSQLALCTDPPTGFLEIDNCSF